MTLECKHKGWKQIRKRLRVQAASASLIQNNAYILTFLVNFIDCISRIRFCRYLFPKFFEDCEGEDLQALDCVGLMELQNQIKYCRYVY